MKITVRYFAHVRESLGTGREDHELPEQIRTLGAMRVWLTTQSERHAQVLDAARSLRMACNQTVGDAQTELQAGCEVAFFPPVTGG
ncbi:molybdopterin synthase, small subunit [Thiomonas sp. X19]|uniref:Molybdopterin-converting factor subunit 1 (MPT synthase subunit 1) (Molybdopterin synthase subunit 1) (Molybdenum cofactor biosynthesis protein D) (Molybdopterin-converting factor small subunit) n=1 Tax=mine drainage metagenome TaxID=410659 RepID=E6PNF7_9ZZZZ|nr:molybdopterin converting factor subunit 1 [Thiomonas sp. X19]SCC94805.1 molybdopterin synthase, small subunit [Thiomonas sp. X19]